MKFEVTVFGAKILETITSGLYDGNVNCLREYVQNGVDAGSKNVKIYFENNGNDLVICDDGRGMNEDELKTALSVGISYKKPEETGWRGIGIWSGVSACAKVLVTTKKANEKKLCIEIDCNKLRDGYSTNRPAIDVLTESTGEIEEVKLNQGESVKDHFTVVRLNSILPTQKPLFRKQPIKDYLSRVVPAPFDNKVFSFAAEIDEFLDKNGAPLPAVITQFEGETIVRPPYVSNIFHNKVAENEFKVGGEKVAVAWFLTQSGKKKLRTPNKGIFFKKKGFTIGDEYLVENQTEKSYSEWQYGEIHIVTEKIRENAARNNFEANNEFIQPLLEQVAHYVNQLQNMNQYQSMKIQTPTVNKVAELISKGDQKAANVMLAKAKKNVNTRRTFPLEASLQVMKPTIDAKSNEDKAAIVKLEAQLKVKKPEEELLAKKKEQLTGIIEHVHPKLKEHLAKLTLKGKLEPEISLVEKLVELLKERTGSTDNELLDLSRFAYGWKEVMENPVPRLLTITGASKDHRDIERNLEFGVMIHALQHLFVNAKKHGVGKDSFKWFEELSELEKWDVMKELVATVDLIYRMIEKSQINEP